MTSWSCLAISSKNFLAFDTQSIVFRSRIFQRIRARARDRGSALRAGMRKCAQIIFNFHVFWQLLHFYFRRELPDGGADPLFGKIETHRGVPYGRRKNRPLKLVVHPGIEQNAASLEFICCLFLSRELSTPSVATSPEIQDARSCLPPRPTSRRRTCPSMFVPAFPALH